MIRLLHSYFPTRTLLFRIAEAGLISAILVAATIVCSGSEAKLVLMH